MALTKIERPFTKLYLPKEIRDLQTQERFRDIEAQDFL